jgi:hypothetical protein
MLELEMAVVGVGSGLVLNDADGFQEGVDGVGMGVWDEGFQAGVTKETNQAWESHCLSLSLREQSIGFSYALDHEE